MERVNKIGREKGMKCIECGSEDSKYRYKCCLLHFCSNTCYKLHKCNSKISENECKSFSDGIEESEGVAVVNSWVEGGIKLTDKQIEILKNDNKLKEFIKNDEMRKILIEISSSSDPIETSQKYIKNEEFNEFINYLLNIIQFF